jgi:radical SAM superfamily enzyme YgiQ (UPF0313 family)
MTDILFVNPPLTLKERYEKMEEGGSSALPLGLCSLAAVAREAGFETGILDCAALNLGYEEAVGRILKEEPKYVGITAVTISIYNASKLIKALKAKNKDITVIIGGPHISAVPADTLKRFPEFDMGVIGEGEATIVELLKALKKKKDISKIDGLVFRKGKKILLTKTRRYVEDMDKFPFPAWDLLPDIAKYYRPPLFSFSRLPSSSIVTSRGCPGQCTFCDRTVFGNCIRGYSARYVFRMMKYLHEEYGIRDILIDDDTFVVLRNRTKELCNMLAEAKMDLTWSCNARVNHVTPDLLKLMKKAGCWQIAYGIESGSQEILDKLKKGIKLETIRQALRWTKEAGIKTKGFFMIGNPTETVETIKKTIDFALDIDLDDFQISIFTPIPGSEIYANARKYGSFEDNWKKMNMWYPVFVPRGLTSEQLVKYQSLAMRKFYLRPKIILSYLSLGLKNPLNLVKMAKGAVVLLKTM